MSSQLPEISEAEQTPLVQALLRTILELRERIEALEEENKRLKELKGKPKVKPSRMDAETETEKNQSEDAKPQEARKPGPKRSKTGELRIHAEQVIAPQGLPRDAKEQGWRFKGYDDYVVQDLKLVLSLSK